jgi:CheY-like chemotaxis protein
VPRVVGRVLIVEDSPQNQELIRAVLDREGHRCALASDGAEGLALARAGGFDLIVMDMQMPRLDGIAATRAIRALPGAAGAVPILALTANALPDQVALMQAAGADGHLAKPFAVADLAAAAARLLGGTGASGGASVATEAFDAIVALLGPEWVAGRIAAVTEGLGWLDRDAPDAQARAHRLVSEAGQLGLVALAEAAERLEAALRDGGDAQAALAALRAARARTKAALPGLRARLAGLADLP